MKILKWTAFGIALLLNGLLHAQVVVNTSAGLPPTWAPAGNAAAEYYYIPDIESYYDVKTSQFIYLGDGKWVRQKQLPLRYRNYDLNNGYKVVLTDYHGRAPYTYFKNHKVKYYKGFHGEPYRRMVVKKKYKHHKQDHKQDHNEDYKEDYKENHKAGHEGREHGRGHGKEKD